MAWRVHRKDRNHNEIVYVLDKIGFSVYDLSQVGGGMSDIIVGINGVNFLFEIKTDKGRLNAVQKEFHGKWQGDVTVIRSAEEAMDYIAAKFAKKSFDKLMSKYKILIPDYKEEYRLLQEEKRRRKKKK